MQNLGITPEDLDMIKYSFGNHNKFKNKPLKTMQQNNNNKLYKTEFSPPKHLVEDPSIAKI